MTNLGDLGVTRVKFHDTFNWFGSEIATNPEFSELDLIDFLESADGIDEADPSAITLVKKLMRSAIAPDDFDNFWDLAKKNGQGSEDLMKVYQKVVESVAKRPSGPPSESADGRQRTAVSSTPDLSSRVIAREAGRMDTQAIIIEARKHLNA